MVKCEFCLNFDGIKCTHPNGTKYKQEIKDSFEEINCPYYFEKGFAGVMTQAFDDEFFDLL
ncbi:MAG: hypothetical protein DRN29_06685 [Thermoplasmata archaeon]|nr:MAG: hypothetical protein DRN29_06685 [Thermoplasmata archaeon]